MVCLVTVKRNILYIQNMNFHYFNEGILKFWKKINQACTNKIAIVMHSVQSIFMTMSFLFNILVSTFNKIRSIEWFLICDIIVCHFQKKCEFSN